MNAITSYMRHLIVTGLTLLIAKFKLPLEGAEQFADGIALFVIATLTWAIVKYAPPGVAKFLGFTVMVLVAGLMLPSCSPGVPIRATLFMPEGSVSYSSKGGIEASYRNGFGDMPDVYRESSK